MRRGFVKVAAMKQQMSFAQSEYAGKKKVTRRERFLGEMERVVPWARLCAVIEPHYPEGKRGRPPIGIERMLRIYCLQQGYALADEALEDAIYDSQALRTFAGIHLSVEAVPDATTLLKFRHLLEAHDLTRQIFVEVGALLSERKLLMREGTIVDATIIAAPSSTKNARKQRDPEMHQTKKGNQWYFGMKAQHRRGRAVGIGAQRDRHGGQRGRHRANPCLAPWPGEGSLRRRGLSGRREARGDRHAQPGRDVARGC